MGRSRSRTGPGRGVAARGRPDGERADGEPQPEARDTGVHARRSGFAVRVFCSSWRGMAGVQTRGLEIAEALAVRRFSILSPVGRAGLTLAVARGCSPSITLLCRVVIFPLKFCVAARAGPEQANQPRLHRVQHLFPRSTRSFF